MSCYSSISYYLGMQVLGFVTLYLAGIDKWYHLQCDGLFETLDDVVPKMIKELLSE